MVVVLATLAVVVGLSLTTDVQWFYPRPLTTVAVMVAVALATLVARRLLPAAWRPDGALALVTAGVAGYVFLQVSVFAGWVEFLDNLMVDDVGGEVHDLPLWLFAGLGAAGLYLGMAIVSRLIGRHPEGDEPT